MFVYGVPGTGKTATVKSVMRRIRDEGEYSFEYIEVNGMRLSSPRMAYNYLWKQLQGGLDVTDKTSLKPNAALARLNEFFSENSKTNINASSSGGSTSSNKKKKAPRNIILLLDEMDLLVTKDQGVLYNFFQWTTMPGSRLFVAGIANTMNLPQILSQKIGSRMGS
jgi:origin recognition complex subunit 1